MENKKTRYLYGAAVQGIQDFIFQTNKLREIVGASELVEQICTTAFDKYAVGGESIVRAAGNIKYLFNTDAACAEAVENFPRKVMSMAPGITISQAVVSIHNEEEYAKKADELEKLLIAQRNKQVRPVTVGLMSIKRAPSTGFPAIAYNKDGDLIDEASLHKSKHATVKKLAVKSFGKEISDKQIAYNIEEIVGKNNWIAIIHADGNGIGNIVKAVAANQADMSKFSKMLDDITKIAANKAYDSLIENNRFDETKIIPLRPVVLSGDDMTLICRADLAVDYTKKFIEEFEIQSQNILKGLSLHNEENKKFIEDGLTACAGIAFVKASYPFHYAVHLAEILCSRAKKASKRIDKDLAPSCLMFHKVQDSFIEDFSKIAERELIPSGTKLTFEAGPYYCGRRALEKYFKECPASVDTLLKNIKIIKDSPVKSHIREWLNLLFNNVGFANQKMQRVINLNPSIAASLHLNEYKNLGVDEEKIVPFYDMLSLLSILYNETNKIKED